MTLELFVEGEPGPPGPPSPPPPVIPPVTPTHSWKILVRDGTFTPRAVVDDYTQLTFVVRWNAIGAFILTVPASSAAVDHLRADRAGIIVLADGQVVFSGPVRSELRVSRGGLQQLQVSGVDDMFWLAARVAHPEPDQETVDGSDHYQPNVYDTRTGVCSTVLAEYVDVNLGPSAIPRRQIPTLTFDADLGLGSDVTGNGRWQPLLELLQRKAIESDPTVSFRLRQADPAPPATPALVFSTSLPTDRSATAIFQLSTGTLGDFSWERAAGNANYIYGLGKGAEELRLVAEAENGADIIKWGLAEAALDRRDLGGEALLRQAAAAEVAQQAGIFRTDLHVIDTAGLAWLDGYDLGDRVSVIIDDVRLVELVREVQVDVGPGDTENVTASVSSPSRKASVRQARDLSLIADLQARVRDLERNQ